jgi:hypothetical protein
MPGIAANIELQVVGEAILSQLWNVTVPDMSVNGASAKDNTFSLNFDPSDIQIEKKREQNKFGLKLAAANGDFFMNSVSSDGSNYPDYQGRAHIHIEDVKFETNVVLVANQNDYGSLMLGVEMENLNFILYKEDITISLWGNSHVNYANTIKDLFVSSMRSLIQQAVADKLDSIDDIFSDKDHPAVMEVSGAIGFDWRLFEAPKIKDDHVQLYLEGLFASGNLGHWFAG